MEIDILREAASRVRPNPDLAAGTSSLLLCEPKTVAALHLIRLTTRVNPPNNLRVRTANARRSACTLRVRASVALLVPCTHPLHLSCPGIPTSSWQSALRRSSVDKRVTLHP